MDSSAAKSTRVSIQVQLAMTFVALLLALGAILGWFHHQKTSDIFLTSSKELFDQIAREVSNSFYSSYNPVSTTVRLLSQSPIINDENLQDRLKRLPVLKSVLEAQPEVAALEVGYSDSEFFIIRRLDSEYMLRRFGAPDNAAYVVDNIEREDGQPVFTRLYYDDSLALMGEKDMGYTSYNPTIRPWYRLAVYSQDVTTTSPYLYYFIGKVGVTLVNQDKESGNVFAADITLESLSRTLIKNKASPSSQMMIYTSDEEVIASLNPESIVVESGPDKLSILKLTDLNNEVISDFFEQAPKPNNSHFFFDSGGQRWIGVNRPISLVGFTAHLLILAPEHELLATAYSIRNQSLLITVAIILLAIPAALFIANKIARPLHRLSTQTKPILALNFAEPIEVESTIRDIQRLGEASEFMRAMVNRLIRLINTVTLEDDPERLLKQVSREAMEIGRADGVLIYLLDDNGEQLLPSAFCTESGCKSSYSFPRLAIKDRELALVSAFHNNDISQFDISYDDVASSGTHESLLNHLGAERLKACNYVMVNRQGQRCGLLCLFYQAGGREPVGLYNKDLQQLMKMLASFIAIAIERQD